MRASVVCPGVDPVVDGTKYNRKIREFQIRLSVSVEASRSFPVGCVPTCFEDQG